MNFVLKSEARGDGVILFLFGKFDFMVKKEDFFHALQEHEDNLHRLFIDLQNVSFIDSAGVGVLALFTKTCQAANRGLDLKILNPLGQVREALQLTNFSELAPVVDSDSNYSSFTSIPTSSDS